MKAAFVSTVEHENPLDNLSIGDLPIGAISPLQCRVRVRAASLNHHDLWTLRGVSSQPVTPPQILGCDAVGVIEAYAPGAQEPYPVGTRVVIYGGRSCGHCDACRFGEQWHCREVGMISENPYQGSFAEFLDVPTTTLIALPDSVTNEAAACLPTAYVTAYRMLFEKASVQPGSTVLVQGASGGVSTAAILLASAAGATVLVTSRTPKKRAFALSLGATAAVAPDKDGMKEGLAAISAKAGVDVVIETVGEATWDLSIRSVRPQGKIVVAGSTTGNNPGARLNRVFWFQLDICGSTGGSPRILEKLVRLVAEDRLHPAVDSVIPLDEIHHGMERLMLGKQEGKIVVSIPS